MMIIKSFPGVLLLILLCFSGYSQEKPNDTPAIPAPEAKLLEILKHSKPGIEQADALVNLSDYLYNLPTTKPIMDRAMGYAYKARDISASIKYPKGLDRSEMLLGCIAVELHDPNLARTFLRATKDSVRMEVLIALSYYYGLIKTDAALDTSLNYAHQAKALGAELHLPKREAAALKQIAFLHYLNKNYRPAEKEFLELIELCRLTKLPMIERYFNILSQISGIYGDYDKALYYGLEALKSMQTSKDSTYAAGIYNNLGIVFRNTGQFQKSIDHYRLAMDIYKKKEGKFPNNMIYNIADAMQKMEQSKEALAFIENAIKENPPATARDKTEAEIALGNAYKKTGQNEIAEKHFMKIFEINNDKNYFDPDNFKIIGQFYVEWHKYELAKPYLVKTLEYSNKNLMHVATLAHLHFLLYRVDSAAGDYASAIQHLMRNKALDDTIYQETKVKEIQNLRIKYETELKDKDIQFQQQNITLLNKQNLLQKENLEQAATQLAAEKKSKEQSIQLARAETDKKDKDLLLKQKDIEILKQESLIQKSNLRQTAVTRNVVIGGTVMLFLLLALLYNRYQVKQKTSREITSKNIALQNLVAEKERLLKEVHHRVKNNLQTVVSLLESQSSYLQSDALLAIQDSQNRVHAMALVHQKLYQADNIACINMEEYIPELVNSLKESFNAKHIHFYLQVLPVDLDVSQAIPIGLIINEAITNCIKYAFAGKTYNNQINVIMHREGNNTIQLVIKDNGVGLPTNLAGNKGGGLGLKLMKGLTEDIEGQFSITSQQGTIVSIKFTANTPLHKIAAA